MSWTPNDGDNQSPWGAGKGSKNGSGGGNKSFNSGDYDQFVKDFQKKLKSLFPNNSPINIIIFIIIASVIWLGSGFFRVNTDEQGVVTRFGEYVRTSEPGLHYHLPYPIEKVFKPKVTKVNRIEIGFRTSQSQFSQNSQTRQVPEEALMLTGDENIVDLNFTIFWIINDAKDFLFNVRNPEITIKSIGESVMREKIGQTPINPILSEGKSIVEEDAKSKIQEVLDYYQSGVLVTQVQLQKADPPEMVIDSFRDVQRAKTDEQKLINEAQAYRNDIIPKARGAAEKMIQEAEAYKKEVVSKAEGEAERFLSVYDSYKDSKDVTRQRIYLETLEKTLGKIEKVIVDNDVGNGVVPYLPLPELKKRSQNTGDTNESN
ncbi:MAG: FtsH protease activity modulator HflK [Rickettsiales bacterium]|nr:FtsH protease activity modulator HflK [Rickettsiales bacterium]